MITPMAAARWRLRPGTPPFQTVTAAWLAYATLITPFHLRARGRAVLHKCGLHPSMQTSERDISMLLHYVSETLLAKPLGAG